MLEIKDLTKKYGDFTALDSFTITLDKGIYGILGANGAGKTTLSNLITDNIKRTSGDILYNGKDILTLGKTFRDKLGYTPQLQGMYDYMTAVQFLSYIGSLKGLKSKEIKKQSLYYLALVNLEDSAYKKLGSFSGGMKQRVLLACAMLGDPEILILDEPTAGLDPEERIRLRNYISKIGKDKTILLTTHVVGDLECIADEVLIMSHGRLIERGKVGELISLLDGKVGEITGTFEEITELREKLGSGEIAQRRSSFALRVCGDVLPDGFTPVNNITLEDVYLYYAKERSA